MPYTDFSIIETRGVKTIFLKNAGGQDGIEIRRDQAFAEMDKFREAKDKTSCDTISRAVMAFDVS